MGSLACGIANAGLWGFNARPSRFPATFRTQMHLIRVEKADAVQQSADELQQQLESLMEEARAARQRADKARSRFMRLTEAVEQMSMRAVAEVKAGNEEAARQLLIEKKNVMGALELSKKRAELLEEFAIKLNEVISKKETRLIASLSWASLSLENDSDNSNSDVRIVSPKEGDIDENIKSDYQASVSKATLELPPFGKYILDIDGQICSIQGKLEDFLEVANILHGNEEIPDERITLVEQILYDLHQARSRIGRELDADQKS